MQSQKCYLLAAAFHVCGIAWYYSIHFAPDDWVGGHLEAILHRRHSFLTNITFEASLAYFLLNYQKPPLYSRLFEKLQVIALFVTFGYWAAFFALHDKIDTDLPLLLNLMVHGGNAVVLFLSRKVTGYPYYRPSSMKENVKFALVTGVVYNLIMALHRWRFGFEVYSFYGELDLLQKIGFNLCWVVWMPLCSAGLDRYYYWTASEGDNDCETTISEACTEMTDFD